MRCSQDVSESPRRKLKAVWWVYEVFVWIAMISEVSGCIWEWFEKWIDQSFCSQLCYGIMKKSWRRMGKFENETRIWRSMPWIESSVRRETRISKIWFGGSITKVLLRQTSEHRTKTNSFVRERSFRAGRSLRWLHNLVFFLLKLSIFCDSIITFPKLLIKIAKNRSVEQRTVPRTTCTFTKKSETAPRAPNEAFAPVAAGSDSWSLVKTLIESNRIIANHWWSMHRWVGRPLGSGRAIIN